MIEILLIVLGLVATAVGGRVAALSFNRALEEAESANYFAAVVAETVDPTAEGHLLAHMIDT